MTAQTVQNDSRHAADTKDAAKAQERAAAAGPKIDLSQLKSSYCNVCNVTSTREELVLTFGLNQSWDISAKREDMEISLQHRVILSPFVAQRLQQMLGKFLEEYENRYGPLAQPPRTQ